jgi:hypothetical protein
VASTGRADRIWEGLDLGPGGPAEGFKAGGRDGTGREDKVVEWRGACEVPDGHRERHACREEVTDCVTSVKS